MANEFACEDRITLFGLSREEDFWRGPVGCFDKSENPDKVKVVAKKAERLETWVDL